MKKPLAHLSFLMAICLLFTNCYAGSRIVAAKAEKPLNIILLIGDGMGLAQISAAAFINGGLSLEQFTDLGLSKTSSSNDYITDSAAGATALSTGEKTYNGAVGVGPDSLARQTILELAEQNGLSTGLISTCSITHATPASFYAHRKDREMHSAIASDLYGKGIDFIAGTGKPYFDVQKLMQDAYRVYTGNEPQIQKTGGKNIWFLGDSIHPPRASERGDFLARATELALDQLSANPKGFFLMVEGSQIDWGGHNNDFKHVVEELIDFDRAVSKAYAFASKHGNTLVVVTADHETGGLSLDAGNLKDKTIEGHFSSTHHSGIMVPVFAYGPGSDKFRGSFENTAVFVRMKQLFGF